MITIIDYGLGNLRSVQKAFEFLNHHAIISSKAEDIKHSSAVILPGVGAFSDGMNNLRKNDLIEPIYAAVEEGKPFLGICLGMQLLFEKSFEGGEYDGLGLISGEVVKFKNNVSYKIPHMGWNSVEFDKNIPLLKENQQREFFYFVHSYYNECHNNPYCVGRTEYGEVFTSIVRKGNVYGTQFHPEKSGNNGLKILKCFGELSNDFISGN